MNDLQSLTPKDLSLIKIHFEKIYSICGSRFEKGNGSYLFDGYDYQYIEDVHKKQSLLFSKAIGKNNVLEIGTYMGHSLLLMLVANPMLSITTIDINDKFSKPAVDYLKSQFPEAEIEFIHGDSLKILRKLVKKFDFFHIDGCHKNKIVTKEFNECKRLSKTDQLEIIFDDDYNCKDLVKNIENTYNVIEKISKGHSWYTNLYLKINLPKNKFKYFTLNIIFNVKNIIKYVIFKLKKLSQFKKI